MPAHVPEAVPGRPAPSKRVPDVVLDIPVLVPPLKLPAGELMPVHVAVLVLAGGLSGEVPDVVGLIPVDPRSVVPSGIPVGGTGAAGPMPSGEVIPSGDGALVLIWAHAGPHNNNAAIAPINDACHDPRLLGVLALSQAAMICSRGQPDRLAKGGAE